MKKSTITGAPEGHPWYAVYVKRPGRFTRLCGVHDDRGVAMKEARHLAEGCECEIAVVGGPTPSFPGRVDT